MGERRIRTHAKGEKEVKRLPKKGYCRVQSERTKKMPHESRTNE